MARRAAPTSVRLTAAVGELYTRWCKEPIPEDRMERNVHIFKKQMLVSLLENADMVSEIARLMDEVR